MLEICRWKKAQVRLLGAALMGVLIFAGAAFAGEKLSAVEDLKDQPLAAQRGTVGQFLAEDLLGDKKDLLTTYEKYVDAIAALKQGKVRAVVMDEAPARRFLEHSPELVLMEEPLSVENYAIAFKKGNTELVNAVNEALREMKKDGSLEAIFERYHGGTEIRPEDIDMNPEGKNGDLIMGTEAGFAPYELKVGDGYIGIDVEMAAAIAKKLGRKLVIQNMNFDALPMAVATGKVDMICAGLTVTEDRKKNMDFSEDYVEGARQVMVVRADDLEAPAGK